MLLITAIVRSEYNIACRRKEITRERSDRKKYQYEIAFAPMSRLVFIYNGRNGTIRRITALDQEAEDWLPFAAKDRLKFMPRTNWDSKRKPRGLPRKTDKSQQQQAELPSEISAPDA